jgi:subfamily B ATP-binding cassette protein MsbA
MFNFFSYFKYLGFSLISTLLLILITFTTPFGIAVVPGLGKMLYEKVFVTLDTYLLYKYLGIEILLLICNCILALLFSLHASKISITVSNSIKRTILFKLFNTKISFYNNHDTGFIVKRIVEDSQLIASGIATFLKIGCNLLIIFFLALIMYTIQNWICYVYCGFLFLSIFWVRIWLKPIHSYNLKIGNTVSELYSYYWQVLPGIKEMKINNLYEAINRKIKNISTQLKRDNIIIIIFYSLMYQLSFFFPMAFYSVILVIGLKKIEQGEFTVGLLLGFTAILWEVYNPIQNIFASIDELQTGISAAIRMEVLKKCASEKGGKQKLVNFNQSIEFRNVSLSYDGVNKVLNGLNLKIEKYQKVALVGATGSGKSSITQLLLNLYDTFEGEILIDGHNIKNISLTSLRDKIIFITQDINLFNDTIRNNIDLKNQLSDNEVLDIIFKLNLESFIGSLPGGMYTKIGENGFNVSGGIKQRISFGRCFASGAPIIVLDEISSALDPETESNLMNELDKFLIHKTVLSISHKPAAIRNYDKICVLKNGAIVEQGTIQELSNINGEFCSLFNINEHVLC